MSSLPILIAGGGIAGLAAALACAGANHDAVVLERAASFDEIGAGLQLGPNAARALEALGAWDAVAAITSQPPEIHIRDGLSGKIVKRVRLEHAFEKRFGAPYRVAHRADLHRALLTCVRATRAIAIRMDVEVQGVDQSEAEARVAYGPANALRGMGLIGADGIGSRIRQQLYPAAIPIAAPLVLHRALLAHMPTVAGIDFSCVNLWLCPNAHVVHYPVGRDGRLNIVAATPHQATPATVCEAFSQPLRDLLLLAPQWRIWPANYLRPLSRWDEGRILLLGDAAHGTLPYLAQGAAMALEDAACLAGVLPNSIAVEEKLSAVAKLRRRRATQLHAATLRAGSVYHAQGLARFCRNSLLHWSPESAFVSQLAWIYGSK